MSNLITKAFRKIYTKDEDLNRVQDSVKASLDALLTDMIINRAEFAATILTTDTVIKHNLGRVPVGFVVTDTTVDSTIWRVAWDASTVTLKASANSPIKFFLI